MMSEKKIAQERIEKLKKLIDEHRYAYHVEDKETFDAEALDSLKKELFDLEQAYPEFVTPDSPTQRVGGLPLKEFSKVRHISRMNSLNDAFSEKDMHNWVDRVVKYLKSQTERVSEQDISFYCDLKMDGLAIELEYEKGLLIRASTRGNGETGEDITQNIKTIDAVPLKLRGDAPEKLVVRGEAFLTHEEFKRINAQQKKGGEKEYANPRNLVAGSIRQLDPKITAARKIDFFTWGIASPQNFYKKHSDEFKALSRFGFKTNSNGKICKTLEDVETFQGIWEKQRKTLPYDIDGVVVFIDDNVFFRIAGVVGKAPRGAIAYKFSPKTATTRVQEVKIQVGRTGILTPVAVLAPVELSGVTITHATLHNFDEIGRLGLKAGDTVIVSRAGDVIPKIDAVLKDLRSGKEKTILVPKICPVDHSPVVQEGVYLRCTNKLCGAQHQRQLRHFVSKGAFNIEGLGVKIINRFLDEGLIVDAADIFLLQEGDISVLERFGEKSAHNIIEEIRQKKHIVLDKFLYALGILHIGEENARVLADMLAQLGAMHTPDDIYERGRLLKKETLEEVAGFGEKIIESIMDWFLQKNNKELLHKLTKAGVTIGTEKKQTHMRLQGKTFCFTGELEGLSREHAKEMVRSAGGHVVESVSKNLSYVVAGADPGSKLQKAQNLGIAIIDKKQFLKILEA